MHSHVLVGADGSRTSRRAVEAAALLAVGSSARLTIGHAFTPHGSSLEADRSLAESGWLTADGVTAGFLVQDAIDRARAIVCGGIRVEGRAEPGAPVPVLLRLIEELDVDAVVIGNADLRLRSPRHGISERVAAKTQCDIIVIDTVGRCTRSRAA